MTPFLFGDAHRQLFGVLHPAGVANPSRTAVVLCNPFGQEAVRTHRIYRVLAERLARKGIDVLRFDYYGTGDSGGEGSDGDIDGWALDLHAAHRELERRCAPQFVTWMGSRLGAAVVLRAAQMAAPASMRRIVLYEPVIDGVAYAQLLRREHVRALEASFSVAERSWRQQLADDPQAFTAEAVGFELSKKLRSQLAALAASSLPLPSGREVRVVADPANGAVQQWVDAHSTEDTPVAVLRLAQTFDWISDEAMRQALVPAPVIAHLIAAIDG